MKKLILLLFVVFSTSPCLASQPIFTPQKTDTLWYTWAEYNGENTEILISHWNGANWTDPYKLTDNSANGIAPAVGLDNKNNPWVVWTGYDGISTSIYCRYHNGDKWSEIRQVDGIDIYWDSCPAVTIDKNNIPWVTWAGSDGKDDDIYVSTWNGKDWTPEVLVNNDDFTPDTMPVISSDTKGNIVIAWSGFSVNTYKLFYSVRQKNKWQEEMPVIKSDEGFSTEFPNILKNSNGTLELVWSEKNLYYKCTWDGKEWSDPLSIEILLPQDFFNVLSVGISSVSWLEDNINQSFRIISSPSKKTMTACLKYNINKPFAWLKDFLCPEAFAAVEENKYIAFGDSITQGVGATDISPFNPYGYPPRLQGKLIARIGPLTVINEGIGGEYTTGGFGRIDDVLNEHNAKFILIMEGTNDITAAISTDTIMFNLGQIIQHSKDFGTTPLIATLTPRMDFLNDRVELDINPSITQLAKDKGVTLVDQYTEMAKDTASYMSDGRLHPNDAGYELMAETWYTAINNILNPPKEKDDSGCGIVPPIYRNRSSNNLFPFIILFLFILFIRIRLTGAQYDYIN